MIILYDVLGVVILGVLFALAGYYGIILLNEIGYRDFDKSDNENDL